MYTGAWVMIGKIPQKRADMLRYEEKAKPTSLLNYSCVLKSSNLTCFLKMRQKGHCRTEY